MKLRYLVLIFSFIGLRAAEPVDILVQGADKLESTAVVEKLEGAKKTEIGPFSFWIGHIGPHRVAVMLTGESVINCVTGTIIGIEEFSPKLIINQGTSGAQAPYLQLHDIIIGERVLDYGNAVMPYRTKGQASQPLDWKPIYQQMRLKGGELTTLKDGFKGDTAAMEIAMRTRNPWGRVFKGVIGSAHEVNLELDRVKWSHDTFGMDVEEMESGHVAAVAAAFNVRYVAFRVVSDAPYEGITFIAQAARGTAQFTVNFLHNLP